VDAIDRAFSKHMDELKCIKRFDGKRLKGSGHKQDLGIDEKML
jgi:hypothetical protein